MKKFSRKKKKEYIDKYIQYLKYSGKSRETIRTKKVFLRIFLDWLEKPLDEIGREDFMDFYKYLEEERGWKKQSIAQMGHTLKSFFKFLGEYELAMWIPIPVAENLEETPIIPKDLCMKIIGNNPMLAVMYDLALRVSELRLLCVEKYNPKTGEIEVTRLKHKNKPNKYILTLSPHVRDLLNKYIEKRGIKKGKIFPYTSRYIQYVFKRQVKRAGLDPEKYHTHQLRHSRISHIVMEWMEKNQPIDPVKLAKFAGHLSLTHTMRYIHLASKYLAFRS